MIESNIPKFVVDKAVQIYAGNPMIQHQEVAKMLDISEKKLRKLRRESEFHQKVYDYYMVTFETDVVAVLKSMVREAVAGNTTAGRIVLEHSGKLAKNININLGRIGFNILTKYISISGTSQLLSLNGDPYINPLVIHLIKENISIIPIILKHVTMIPPAIFNGFLKLVTKFVINTIVNIINKY